MRVSAMSPHYIQLAPENTMMAFERSVACGVTAFETDVQLRYSLSLGASVDFVSLIFPGKIFSYHVHCHRSQCSTKEEFFRAMGAQKLVSVILSIIRNLCLEVVLYQHFVSFYM